MQGGSLIEIRHFDNEKIVSADEPYYTGGEYIDCEHGVSVDAATLIENGKDTRQRQVV